MTKTRVNLFTDTLLPPKQRLTLNSLGLICVLILVVGGGALAMLWWQNNVVQTALMSAKQQLKNRQQQLSQLQQQLQQHQPAASLQAAVTKQQQELQLKTLLLNELAQREQLKSVGFTEKLQELAQVTSSDIWLTHLRFDEQQMLFEGYSHTPANVPEWIGALSNTQSFKGKAFASMTMAREDDKPLAFKLTTEPAEEPNKK